MKFYNIQDKYIAFLKTFDDKIANNKQGRRPYVGIVFKINDVKYYAPFSSPKPKHKKMKNGKDMRKIRNGDYGVINFNNMIPVVDSALILIDIDKIEDAKYKRLLQNQYVCVKSDAEQIQKTAAKLHTLIFTDDSKLSDHDKHIKQRCCDLILLESHIDEYHADGTTQSNGTKSIPTDTKQLIDK